MRALYACGVIDAQHFFCSYGPFIQRDTLLHIQEHRCIELCVKHVLLNEPNPLDRLADSV